jgi:hypothetical protein
MEPAAAHKATAVASHTSAASHHSAGTGQQQIFC